MNPKRLVDDEFGDVCMDEDYDDDEECDCLSDCGYEYNSSDEEFFENYCLYIDTDDDTDEDDEIEDDGDDGNVITGYVVQRFSVHMRRVANEPQNISLREANALEYIKKSHLIRCEYDECKDTYITTIGTVFEYAPIN